MAINIENINFQHRVPIQIRFDDIDGMGHVNNSILLSYFDYSKVHYLTAVNSRLSKTKRMDMVIVHYEVDFYKPVLLHDDIYVETAFVGYGTKSLTFIQRIRTENEIKCVCKTIMSGLNKQTGNAEILTECFKQEIERFENKDCSSTSILL